MLNPIQLDIPDDKLFFYSDFHCGHTKEFLFKGNRGFNLVEEHDQGLIDRWNATVPADGVVFHLGDMTFEDPTGERFTQLVTKELRFDTLYCLWGNHLSGQKQVYKQRLKEQYHDVHVDGGEVYPLRWYVDGLGGGNRFMEFLPQYAEVKVRDTNLVLCHYPIESWNGMGKGWLHLHGHEHNALPKERLMPNRCDVGVEAVGAPISLAQLKERFSGQVPMKVGHH